MQAETNRCDVFSSASSRGCAGLFVTRGLDFFGESLGVCQRSLDEYARPPEVARGLLYRFGFLVHREDFPDGDAMAGQYASRPESESRKEIPGNSVSRLFSMTYRATRSLFEVRAARACLVTNRS